MDNTMDAVDRSLTNERNGYSPWDRDYTPTPEVIALVNQVFDYIEANPESWDQREYGSGSSDTNCFVGLLIRISGTDPYEGGKGYYGFCVATGMPLLGMGSTYDQRIDYYDRAEYIAYFRSDDRGYVRPTLDEMRERVSIALNHDFRKPKAFNDPTVDCCERDAADCDCPDKQV